MPGKMIALRMLKEKGSDGKYIVRPTPTDIPEPKKGEALVRVRCAALNHRDNWMTMGMYPKIRFGKTLGSDCSGVVAEVGDSADRSWVGQDVLVDPSLHWGPSIDAPGPQFSILGVPTDGTFAEYVVIPVTQLYRKPAHLTDAEGAALPLAGATAWRCLVTKGRCRKGSKVLITGIGGGVALFALQFAVALGAEVTVTSSQPDKLQRAKDLGASHTANYKTKGWGRALQKSCGLYDCIVDGAAGPDFDDLIRLLKPGGKLVTYGVTAGPPKRVTLPNLFLNNADIVGTAMSAPQEFADMLQCVASNGIRPVVDTELPMASFEQLLGSMRKGAQFGKLVMRFSDSKPRL
eukprot:TRINITY_DN9956_c0_g1_i1.p1 TRINITY_DN9956_c0_g1~~TRINITY_DN9956_c0_g1_i1.p1  ORF type:complete len:372 (+),score=150.14 TRINITY_DN9956_c0_g1_i1:75-1118(+)